MLRFFVMGDLRVMLPVVAAFASLGQGAPMSYRTALPPRKRHLQFLQVPYWLRGRDLSPRKRSKQNEVERYILSREAQRRTPRSGAKYFKLSRPKQHGTARPKRKQWKSERFTRSLSVATNTGVAAQWLRGRDL